MQFSSSFSPLFPLCSINVRELSEGIDIFILFQFFNAKNELTRYLNLVDSYRHIKQNRPLFSF